MRVIDQERLSHILDTILEEYGTQQQAANALGISQGHFSRLRRGLREQTVKRIERKTIQKLEGLLFSKPKLYRKFWRDAIMGPQATAIYDQHYRPWLKKALRPFTDRRGALTSEGLAGQCNRLLHELGRYSQPGGSIGYRPPFGSYFASFDKATRHHRPQRLYLALWRAVEPLLASDESGGIERSVEELEKARDLGPYLRAALKREELLLNREADLERAQSVAVPHEHRKKRR